MPFVSLNYYILGLPNACAGNLHIMFISKDIMNYDTVEDDNVLLSEATNVNGATADSGIDDSSDVSNLTGDDKPQELTFSEFKTLALGKINNMQAFQFSNSSSNQVKPKRITVPSHLRESVDLFGRKYVRNSIVETDPKRLPSSSVTSTDTIKKKKQREKIKKTFLAQAPDTITKKQERESIKNKFLTQTPK